MHLYNKLKVMLTSRNTMLSARLFKVSAEYYSSTVRGDFQAFKLEMAKALGSFTLALLSAKFKSCNSCSRRGSKAFKAGAWWRTSDCRFTTCDSRITPLICACRLEISLRKLSIWRESSFASQSAWRHVGPNPRLGFQNLADRVLFLFRQSEK